MMQRLPALFIGSSTEGLDTAYAIQQALEYDAEPTVWTQGVFQPSESALSSLMKSLPQFDFAAFVFSPDDTLKLRGSEYSAVRDNVIFELGLFMGALGRERCFHVMPRNIEALHLPSDLAGITGLTYNPGRSDGNLLAALGPACHAMRSAIRKAQALPGASAVKNPVQTGSSSGNKLQHYLDMWNGPALNEARALARNGVPLSRYDVDEQDSASWDAFVKIFHFLDSLSSAILAGEVDAEAARKTFGKAIPTVWRHAFTALAMPNHATETWNPPPAIAQVSQMWQDS